MRLPMYEHSNLRPILHCFRDMVDYWSSFRCLKGMPQFKAIVRGEPLKPGLQNLVQRNKKQPSVLICCEL